MNILGLSGRKQSGKNTVSNFLHGIELLSIGLIPDFQFNENGKLIVPTTVVDGGGGEKVEYGIFDLERDKTDVGFCDYMANNVWPFIKAYSFADMLKLNVCVDVLGLKYEQCYGTDDQKNTPTHINRESFAGIDGTGPMTAREVMQYVGTDFFRKIYPNVWADSTIRRIKGEGTAFAIITDCRFPNEVDAIKNEGGKVIRLTRNGNADDNHPSEAALDKENYDWSNFDFVLDNDNMSVAESNEAIYSKLTEWSWCKMDIQS
tara:strand:- start:255 stop:1037 length:783 start_codon:yes stop_codon:yes gene_type:complete